MSLKGKFINRNSVLTLFVQSDKMIEILWRYA